MTALLQDGRLSASERTVCLALALASLGRFDDLARLYERSHALRVPVTLLREAALRTHLFSGFPRAIEAFHALTEATGEFESPESGSRCSSADPSPDAGRAAFERIYRDQADGVRRLLHSFSPVFERAVIEDAYGRILSRPELDPRLGELMAVCSLTALQLPRQLRSHLEGALRCGATREEVIEVIELAGVVCARKAVWEALGLLAVVSSPA